MTNRRLAIENAELREENTQLRQQLQDGIECDHTELNNQVKELTNYIVKIQKQNSRKINRIFALIEGYQEAIEDIQSWAAYATDYFQHKHDLKGCIARHQQILKKGGMPKREGPPDVK